MLTGPGAPLPGQALDAGTTALLPEGLRTELEALEDAGGVRHLTDLKAQIQVGGTHALSSADCNPQQSGMRHCCHLDMLDHAVCHELGALLLSTVLAGADQQRLFIYETKG